MAVMVCPPGRTEVVGMIVVLVSAGVETGALTPRETMLPSVFRAPRVTVVEGPTPSAKQSTLSQDAIVVVITSPPGRVVGTLGAVMTGMRPPAPTLMRLPSAFRAPRVMVAEGPTLSPRQTTPSHDEVVPVLGIPVIIGVNGRPLVIGPTTLVMDAIALDCCDRIEEMEAVASLWTEETMLAMLVGLVTPLVRELRMLEASDTTEETAPVADAPISLVSEFTALVTPEMIGTEEKPGREGLKLVDPALRADEINPEGIEVAVGSSESSELNAPVLIALIVESCETKEESWLPMTPVAVDASDARLDRTPPGTLEKPGREGLRLVEPALTADEIRPEGKEVAVGNWEIKELKAPVLIVLAVESCETREESWLPTAPVAVEAWEARLERTLEGTPTETPPDAPAVALIEAGGKIEEAADERRANMIPLRTTPLVSEL
jgi:hypothetical protein